MDLLIKSAIIIDKGSDLHQKKRDLLIEDGIITKIETTIVNTQEIQELKLDNLHVSVGWFDSSVSFGEPGYEERETLDNGLLTAAKSGFTGIALNPKTHPVIDNRAGINYLLSKTKDYATEVYPIACLTKEAKSEEMAELYDMQEAGAIAFNDYKKATHNPNLLKTILKYAQAFDGLIMSFPQEELLTNNSSANESPQTLELGFKGNPNLAEELQVARDLYLLEYTGGSLHIPTITTQKSVSLIQEAQKKGLCVSCSVSAHHLVLTDAELDNFDTNYKVSPPLRTKNDCLALQQGVKEGVIASITSDHQPLDVELKKKEFAHASSGSIGLESFFGAVNSILNLEDFILSISKKPRSIFGITNPVIAEGAVANLSFFNPEPSYLFNTNHILSSSKNAIFLGSKLKGMVYGIFNKNQLVLK